MGREGEAVLALHGAVLRLEETGGDRRVVPHRHLAGLVLREALVVARVRGILLAGVLHEFRVEVECVLESRLIDLSLVGLAVRLCRPPRPPERIQDGRECGAEVTPARLATQADARHRRSLDLSRSGRDLLPRGMQRHLDAVLGQDVLAIHQEGRLAVERRRVHVTLGRQRVAHSRNEVVVLVRLVALRHRRQVLQQPGGAELRRLVRADHDGVECLAARPDVTGRDLPQLALVEDRVLDFDPALFGKERRRQPRDVLHLPVRDDGDADRLGRAPARRRAGKRRRDHGYRDG